MARIRYGSTGGEVLALVDAQGDYAPATANFSVFTTATGTTQLTDLLRVATDGTTTAATTVVPNASGRIIFDGPDTGYNGPCWLRDNTNPTTQAQPRFLVNPVDATDRVVTVEGKVAVLEGGSGVGTHAANHATGGTDPLSPGDIGAAVLADEDTRAASELIYTDTQISDMEQRIMFSLGIPTAPVPLAATGVSSTSVTINWEASDFPTGSTGTGYRVFRGDGTTQIGADLSAATLTKTDSGRTADTTYRYYVHAFNATGQSPASQEIVVQTLLSDADVPSKPDGLATTVGSTMVALTWNASTSPQGVTGYRLEQANGAGSTTFTEIFTPTTTSQTVTGLTPLSTYVFRVRGYNALGPGAYSDTTEIVMLDAPAITTPTVFGSAAAVTSGTQTTLATTLPASITAGMVGLCTIQTNVQADTVTTPPTSPGGVWTLVDGPYINGANTLKHALYRKLLTNGDAGGSLTHTWSGQARIAIGAIVLDSAQVDNDTFVHWDDTSGDTALLASGFTPASMNTRAVVLANIRYPAATANSVTPAAGWTEHKDVKGTTAAPQMGVFIASKSIGGGSGVAQAAESHTYADTAAEMGWVVTVKGATTSIPTLPDVGVLTSSAVATDRMTLSWTLPNAPTADPITTFRLRDADTTALLYEAMTPRNFTRTGLTQNTDYRHRVFAVNGAGQTSSNTLTTKTTTSGGGGSFPGDPGVGKLYLGNNGVGGGDMGYVEFDKAIFPGNPASGPATKRFKLCRVFSNTLTLELRSVCETLVSSGRIPMVCSHGTNFQQIIDGGADAAIEENVTWMKNIGGPVWFSFWHEPDRHITASAAQQDLYRQAFRYYIGKIREDASNVAVCSPWVAWGVWQRNLGTDKDWRRWHPNYDGPNPPTNQSGGWDYNVIDMDGIDYYNPGANPGPGEKNSAWSGDIDHFFDFRAASGGAALPLCIGELGVYNNLPALNDNGVTAAEILTAIVTTAPAKDIRGVAFWTNGNARYTDAYDPGGGATPAREKRDALKAAINANPTIAQMLPGG